MSLALKLVLAPVLFAQAVRTRRRAPQLPEAEGPREGQLGQGGPAFRVLIVGDSSAAGVGVSKQEHAFAGHFTRTLHRRSGRSLRWRLRAKSGLTTRGVLQMLRDDPPPAADLAVVLTGVNDVIDLLSADRALKHRAELAEWLLDAGRCRYVLFGPLPPIDQFPLLPEPLRGMMGREARLHDEAMASWAATQTRIFHAPIDLRLLPATMSKDGFHPAEPVYRASAEALARFVVQNILPREL